MRSEDLMDNNFLRKKIKPTKTQKEKMEQGWKMKVVDNKLEFIKPEHIRKREQPTVEQLKEMTDNAKDLGEIKSILKLLLDK